MADTKPFETLDPENWDEMRQLAHRMVDDALDYVQSTGDRPAWQAVPPGVAKRLESPAPGEPSSPAAVYGEYLELIQPYTMHTAHPRFWAWYMGSGTVMGALAELLAATLNPNLGGGNHVAPLVEKQVIGWVRDMVGFPVNSSGLLTSGGSMANFTALAAARHAVLRNLGWDVESRGLFGAPEIPVIVGADAHSTIFKALAMLGMGRDRVLRVPIDVEGRMRPDALPDVEGPVIVCLQHGNVNSGAFDPALPIIEWARRRGGWVHVDGAFGLWARASSGRA